MIKKIIKIVNNFIFTQNEFKKILKKLNVIIKEDSVLLIGNSKKALKLSVGKKIDNCKYIVRFNAAPIKNYTKHVGKKTNMVAINQDIFEQKYFNKKIKKDFITKLDKKDIFVVIEKEISKKYNFNNIKKKNNIIFFDNKLNHYLRYHIVSKYNYLKKIYYYLYGKKLSMGAIVLFLFLKLKKKVFIYGFDMSKNKEEYSHYYSSSFKNIETTHDWEFENNIIGRLIRKKKIYYLN